MSVKQRLKANARMVWSLLDEEFQHRMSIERRLRDRAPAEGENAITNKLIKSLQGKSGPNITAYRTRNEKVTGGDIDIFFIEDGQQFGVRMQAKLAIYLDQINDPRWSYRELNKEQCEDLIGRSAWDTSAVQGMVPGYLFYNHWDPSYPAAPTLNGELRLWGCAFAHAEAVRDRIRCGVDVRTYISVSRPWDELVPEGKLALPDRVRRAIARFANILELPGVRLPPVQELHPDVAEIAKAPKPRGVRKPTRASRRRSDPSNVSYYAADPRKEALFRYSRRNTETKYIVIVKPELV